MALSYITDGAVSGHQTKKQSSRVLNSVHQAVVTFSRNLDSRLHWLSISRPLKWFGHAHSQSRFEKALALPNCSSHLLWTLVVSLCLDVHINHDRNHLAFSGQGK